MQPNFTNQNLAHQQPLNLNFQPRLNQAQPPFLTPQKPNQNIQNFPNSYHKQSERIMYKSTLQPTNNTYSQQNTGTFGLGKLNSMGRAVH